jgi:hypothetical protein
MHAYVAGIHVLHSSPPVQRVDDGHDSADDGHDLGHDRQRTPQYGPC